MCREQTTVVSCAPDAARPAVSAPQPSNTAACAAAHETLRVECGAAAAGRPTPPPSKAPSAAAWRSRSQAGSRPPSRVWPPAWHGRRESTGWVPVKSRLITPITDNAAAATSFHHLCAEIQLPPPRQNRAMKSPRVISDPEILGGTPVFVDTRVPVRILFEHLEAGDSLGVFLEDFPSVSRALAIQVLEDAKASLLSDAHRA